MRGRGLNTADASITYDRGRVCSAPGCATELSVYNPSDTCSIHERSRPYMLRARAGRLPFDAPTPPMEEREVAREWIGRIAARA